MSYIAEYIWIDGTKPTAKLRKQIASRLYAQEAGAQESIDLSPLACLREPLPVALLGSRVCLLGGLLLPVTQSSRERTRAHPRGG